MPEKFFTKVLSLALFTGLAMAVCGFGSESADEAEPLTACSQQSAKTCSDGDCTDGKSCKLVTSTGGFNFCACKK